MRLFDPGPSRRSVLGFAAASVLVGCGRGEPAEDGQAASDAPAENATLAWAVAGEWRSQRDKARDVWRHPVETLEFWGLKPGMTVVEFWPGAGWYTDILAPFLRSSRGKLYAANLEPNDPSQPAAAEVLAAYRQKIESRPRVYGRVEHTAFGPTSGPVAPDGSADMVLFLRTVHNWMAAGIAEKAFAAALAALKPGGVLGVEESRADPGGVQDVLASNGYVQEMYVKKLAEEAGFVFDLASDVNANPRDTRDHPFGVWTLPPTRLSAPRGQPADPTFDHAPFDAIGESDRMTLRFVKPT